MATNLNEIKQRLDAFEANTLPPSDSLLAIISDFSRDYQSTFVTTLQTQLTERMTALADTADTYFALFLLLQCDHIYSRYKTTIKYLQYSIDGQYPLALLFTAGSALAGRIAPLDEALIWALKCLRYIDTVVMPSLERNPAEQRMYRDLSSMLREIKERRRDILPAIIPVAGSAEFEKLLEQLLDYRIQRGGEVVYDLLLDHRLFDQAPLLIANNHSGLFTPKAERQKIWHDKAACCMVL